MAKLPVTVTSVTRGPGALYTVTVAFFDGSTGNYIIPDTMATAESVRISALVYAQLSDIATKVPQRGGQHNWRWQPRTPT